MYYLIIILHSMKGILKVIFLAIIVIFAYSSLILLNLASGMPTNYDANLGGYFYDG